MYFKYVSLYTAESQRTSGYDFTRSRLPFLRSVSTPVKIGLCERQVACIHAAKRCHQATKINNKSIAIFVTEYCGSEQGEHTCLRKDFRTQNCIYQEKLACRLDGGAEVTSHIADESFDGGGMALDRVGVEASHLADGRSDVMSRVDRQVDEHVNDGMVAPRLVHTHHEDLSKSSFA
jgi:hypothetical protein